jgi:hypothetical protein
METRDVGKHLSSDEQPLAFREDIKTNKELATRKKEMAFRLTASVRMSTLTHSAFEMLLLPRNI